jgi:hypothetical protein
VLMLLWLISAMGAVANMHQTTAAGRAGQAIGATIGFSIVLGIWMMGDVILGLFVLITRGDKVIIEETPAGAFTRGSIENEPSASTADTDAMLARYLQRQQVAPQGRGPSSGPSHGGFGRRH